MYQANPSRVVRAANMKLADTSNPLLRLSWKDISKVAGTPNDYATITIDNDASTDSKVMLILNLGASSSDYSQYQFSAYATGITDPGSIDDSPTHTQCTTLGALVAAINAVDGMTCRRLHAPADYSFDTDDFVDLTETKLPHLFGEYLYKDASEVLTMAYRLGVPEDINGYVGAGRLEFIRANAYVNSDSATDCIFKMSYDPSETDATDEVELGYTRYIPDSAWTELFDFTDMPHVLNGPVLVELTSTTTLTVTTSQCMIGYRSAEY